ESFCGTFAPRFFILACMSKTLRLPNCYEQALLDQVQVRLVERAELERFKQLLAEHHYLGSLKAVGERLHYVGYRCPGSVAGLAGLQRSSQAPQASRPMDRMERCTAPPSPEPGEWSGRRWYPRHCMKRLLLKRSIIARTNTALSLRTRQ